MPAAITYGTALSGTELDATANTAGAFAYTPSSGTVLGVGSQTLSVLFTPTDTIDYTSATASVTLQVNKVTPKVSVFCSPNPITYGGTNSICTISVTNGATGTVTLAINGSAWTTVTLSSSSATAQFSSTYGIGAFTVGAAYNGDGNNNSAVGSGSVMVTQASQTISFTAPASPLTYGVAPITLSATGGASGNPVVFSIVSGQGSISGSTLTITGAGTVVVAANQAGSTNYSAAAQVTQSVTVNQAALTVTASSASRAYGGANPTFGYTVTGFVNGDTSSVVGGSAAETTSATSTSAPGSYSITFSSEALTATNYTFSYVNGTLTVSQAPQTITFNAPASPVTYGVSQISLSASASSGLAVSFSVSSGSCSVSGSTLTVTGEGTCVVAANQAGNTDYSAAATVSHSIVVNAAVLMVTANNASRVYGAANPTFTASFSGFVNGDTSSVLSGAPSLTTTATATSTPGSYTITAAAGTLAARNYTFSFANGTLTVNAATQTISFTAPVSPVAYGVSPISLSATASSGLAVAFYVSSGPCTVAGTTLTVAGVGTCVVAANQPGNADYTAAAAVVQSLVINKESVTVSSMSSLSPSIYGENVALTFTLTGSGITPTGTVTINDGANTLATISLDAGIAIYNTSALIAGKHTLTAVYSGDNNYQ